MTEETWAQGKIDEEIECFFTGVKTHGEYYLNKLPEICSTPIFTINSNDIKNFNAILFELAKKDPNNFVESFEKVGHQLLKEFYKIDKKFQIHFSGELEKIREQIKNNDPIILTSLSEIENPKLFGKNIQVVATISSNSIPYNVPEQIIINCNFEHECKRSEVLTIPKNYFANFVDIPEFTRKKRLVEMVKLSGEFKPSCSLTIQELRFITIKKIRIRPVVSSLEAKDGKFFDQFGNEWRSYDIFLLQNKIQILEAGREIVIKGLITSDPKNQKISLIAYDIKENESQEYNRDKIKELKEFFSKLSIQNVLNFCTNEFENYSKIIGRGNIMLTDLLTFFSPLYFNFEGKKIAGWAKTVIIGDTTTGKSETVRELIRLLKAGMIITGEMATTAGLGATATQSASGVWFVEWGPLVLQDRKLLAVDGAHFMNREQWAMLAEAEREGKIMLTKAAKGEAYARTRQIKIMNPIGEDFKTTRTMKSFFYPVQSMVNNLQIQSIARQDHVTFVTDDITADRRNKRNDANYDTRLDYLADLLQFVWKQKYDIKFDEEAINEILLQATQLENKFKVGEIPLITNDEKYKLAKLSVSLAQLTCNFNEDFTQLYVTKEHVSFIAEWIKKEYHNAGLDLVRENVDYEITDESIDEITSKVKASLEKHEPSPDVAFCKKLLVWCGKQTKFTKEQLKAKFDLVENHVARPLLASLQNEGLILNKNGFIPTKKLIEIVKKIEGENMGILSYPC